MDRMSPSAPRRRQVLIGMAAGLGGFLTAPFGAGAARAADEPSELGIDPLTPDLVRIDGAGANVVVLTAGDGLALVDSGAPEHADALTRFLGEAFPGAAVSALFNTHWHLPHTGANEALGKAGATILAHENTRLWMSTEFFVKWEDKTYSPRPEAARPTRTFYSSDPQPITFELGGQPIEYGHLAEAHTDGDIYVRFPNQNVIAAGDTVGAGAYPVPDYSTGGWIGGLEAATRRLIELSDAGTRIVPGSGPVRMRADLEAQLEMLTTVRERIEALMRQGRSAEEMIAAHVTEDYDAAWGDPAQFVSNVYAGLWWGGRLGGTL
jgi:glyoxylase-like metal-dependent hydrolase (beta-lactamase superfamily II)